MLPWQMQMSTSLQKMEPAPWKPRSVVDTSHPRLTARSPRTAWRLGYPSACDGMPLGTAATGL